MTLCDRKADYLSVPCLRSVIASSLQHHVCPRQGSPAGVDVHDHPRGHHGRWVTLPAVSLLTELDAFYLDHRRCGELEAGVEGPMVWMQCGCGATLTRRVPAYDAKRLE